MRRALNIAAAAVATLGLAGAELAICCSAHRTGCENVRPGEGSASAIAPESHCARPASTTLLDSCCADDQGALGGVVLTAPAVSGLPGHSGASTPALAPAHTSAPAPIPVVARAPARRSPILRL